MAITTLCRLDDLTQTQDPDILDALAALRHPPVVEEYQVLCKPSWWQRARPHTLYGVLWPLGETLLGPEWEVVNFSREPPSPSINTAVPKALVLAYLYGCSVTRAHEEPSPMPRGRTSAITITLTPTDAATLHAWQRKTTLAAGVARRGRIVLLRAQGATLTTIAARVGTSRRATYKWLRRFQQQGRAGLQDRPRHARQTTTASRAPLRVIVALRPS